MDIEPFLADTWEQGNSIILTIPSHIVKMYDIKSKETCQVFLRKKSKEELRKEKSLNRLRMIYSDRHGVARILQDKKVIAEISTIFFQLRQGVFHNFEELKTLPYDRFHGEIFEGRLLFSELARLSDGRIGYDRRYLTSDCVLEIKEGQKTLKINQIEFDPPIQDNKVDLFEVRIHGQLIE